MEEKLVKAKGSLEGSTSRLIRRTADSAKVRKDDLLERERQHVDGGEAI